MSLSDALARPEISRGIHKIATTSYENPGVLLGQEFKKNNRVYLACSKDAEIEAFFMVGWSTLRFLGETVDCVFLGLSGVAPGRKGSFLAPRLYRKFLIDAAWTAREREQRVVWWFHSASPIVAGVLWKLSDTIGPTPEGFLSNQHAALLEAIQRHYNLRRYRDPRHVCVLRGYAQARYSVIEVDRINTRKGRGESLMERWDIRESSGDRLMFIGWADPFLAYPRDPTVGRRGSSEPSSART